MTEHPQDLVDRASRVRLLLLDVDGVLTDGTLQIGPDGQEFKSFFVQDGMGIRIGQRAGLEFGIISGRSSEVVSRRAAELDITEVHQGVLDKLSVGREILERRSWTPDVAGFIGDDLIDVPLMRDVGFSAAPSDAAESVRRAAHFVCSRAGGRGAVREVIELVLRANGHWDSILRDLFPDVPR